MKGRTLPKVLGICQAAVNAGHREVVIDLICRLEAIASARTEQLTLDQALAAEGRIDGEEDHMVVQLLRDPSSQNVRRACDTIAKNVWRLEQLLCAIRREYPA